MFFSSCFFIWTNMDQTSIYLDPGSHEPETSSTRQMHVFKIKYFEKWQHWFLNEPKSFTQDGNLNSTGYAKAIPWISEVWAAFDRAILARSFDQCDITSHHLEDMHLQLRTFVGSAQFLDTVVYAPLDRDMETISLHHEMAIPKTNLFAWTKKTKTMKPMKPIELNNYFKSFLYKFLI